MFDPERMLGQMLGGALGGAFGGSRTKRRRGVLGLVGGNTAMKAQVGLGLLGIAFAAYEHYTQQRGGFAGANGSYPPAGTASGEPAHSTSGTPAGAVPPPPPRASAKPPPPPPAAPFVGGASAPTAASPVGAEAAAAAATDSIVLMQAMIAAAAADGRIDDVERRNILARARDAEVDADGLRFLDAELAAPKPLAAIVAATRSELAEDVYGASVLAISLDTDAERAYLDALARALSLGEARRATIHARLESLAGPM